MSLKKICFCLFFVWLVMFKIGAFAQNISNEGTDFWMVFPTHDNSDNGSNNPNINLAYMNINVTSKGNSQVTVSCGSSMPITKDIPANTIVTFVIPRPESYINYNEANQLLTNKGIHIKVTREGLPKVVVYGHVFASARSAATLILPYEALGQKYFSMNYTQDNSNNSLRLPSKNFLTLVAADDNTDLIITELNGTITNVNLPKAGDVYEYMPAGSSDLTGVSVEVNSLSSQCKRFAAFSGSTSITIGCSGSRDPLLQQLYSVNSWGKNYGIVPFSDRRHIIRVMAQENNTIVKLNGAIFATLNRGEFHDSQILTDAGVISADKLISVAQYSLTQDCSSASNVRTLGDPEMVLLNPTEFNIRNVTMFSSNQLAINPDNKFINVFIKTAKTATFRLNGAVPGVVWIPMAFDPTYSYAQIKVFDESLTLTADDGFNAIAYGFGGYESYAYSAGTNLYSTSTLSLLNLGSQLESKSSACLGQATLLKLSLPYKLTKITWKDSGGHALFLDQPLGLPVESTDNLGAKIFTYDAPNTIIFPNLGVQKITAIAVLSQADLPPCVVGADIKFDFEIEVVPLGIANFEVPDICAGKPVTLIDKSNIIASQWKWDIDGTAYDVPNPTHTFISQGTYRVKLSVANASGCWSDVFTKSVPVVKDFPQLEFVNLKPVCVTDRPLQLNVIEKLGLAFTKKEFTGKGISPTGIFDPKAAGVGIHKISYTFASKDGCTNTIFQDIEVYASTVIDTEPTIYILAGGERMMPTRINSPNARYKYKYKWVPSVGLSNDAIINPIAFPDKDTKYVLTVSIDGLCSVTQEVFVKVLDKVETLNAFSPNNDQVNDVWNIKSLDSYPKSEITIFNRNGQKVFFSIGYTKPFDGNYRGNPLPVGVYYYIIDPKNGRQKITGSLTIIR